MKFCIEYASESSGRVGQLVADETGKSFKTPLLLQTTKGGSIPHLGREVFDYVTKEPQILQLTLATMFRMMESIAKFKGDDGDLSRYIGFANYPTMLVMHDPCEILQGGHNDRDVVPIFTRHGKEHFTAERYMEMIEALGPDIYIGLCDADTNVQSSKKRVQKSLDRTERFMDECLKWHRNSKKLERSTLFAPIVGGYSTHTRTKSIEHINRICGTDFGGYLLEGFHRYGSSAWDMDEGALYNIVKHCMKTLNADKPCMMLGAYTPIVALELIRLGVDIFDTSYPCCATKNFKALTFSFDIDQKPTKSESTTPILDLTDESFKEDFTPFMRDCSCLACTKHTRAYVHHLYKTRELIGPILLMIHNLHHFMRFFERIRECIAVDKLSELLRLIKFQNGEVEIDYRLQEPMVPVPETTIENKNDTNDESILE